MVNWVKKITDQGFTYENEVNGDLVNAYGYDLDGGWYELSAEIAAGSAVVVDEIDTDNYKNQLIDNLKTASSNYWALKETEDIVYDTKVFIVNIRTFIFASGQIQGAQFYEAVNGAGTWFYNWTLKDGTYYQFDLNSIFSFGMAIAAQVEYALHNSNDHNVVIDNIDIQTNTASEIEAYDFTVNL